MMRWDDGETDHVENPFVGGGAAMHFHDDDEEDHHRRHPGGGCAYGSSVASAPLHHAHAAAAVDEPSASYGYGSPQPRTPASGRRRPPSSSGRTSATPTPIPSTDRTPLFGGGGGVGGGYTRSMAALRASRARNRRRSFLGQLALRTTKPGAALTILASVAVVFGLASWRSVPDAAEAAATVMMMADRPAMGATMNGRNVMIVQPSNLQKKPKHGPPPAPWEGIVPEQLPKPDTKRRMGQAQQQQLEAAMGRTSTGGKTNKKNKKTEDAPKPPGLLSRVKDLASFGPKKEKGFKPKPLPPAGDAGVVWIKDKHGKKTVVLLPKPKHHRAKQGGQRLQQQQEEEEAAMGSTSAAEEVADGIIRPKFLTETETETEAEAADPYGATGNGKNNKQKHHQTKNKNDKNREHSSWEFYVGPLGEKNTASDANGDGNNDSVVTYYYDPTMGSAQPEVVYDGYGKAVKLADLHDEGKNDVFLVPPDAPPGPAGEEASNGESETSNTNSGSSASSSASRNTAAVTSSSSGGGSGNSDGPTQDQLIIVATVATIALLVGALSARRLRSRQFLNSCIENESLEDELAYDAANTMLGTGAAGYDTFATGNIKWRGDLEKFDV